MSHGNHAPSEAARSYREGLKAAGEAPKRASSRGGFFVLDRTTFHHACKLGVRPAVALMILARFTGRSGVFTRASAHAIEQRTGIGRKAAREAIETLARSGIIERLGTDARPRYALQRIETRPPLPAHHAAALARALRGEKLTRSESAIMQHVEAAGYARRCGRWEAVEAPESEPVWLPNALVDGIEGRESPAELLRQSGDVMALRLLVDLYTVHRLDEWGGINRRVIRESYREVSRVEAGTVFVLALETEQRLAEWCDVTRPHESPPPDAGRALWERVHLLERLGLVSFVPHVLDGDGAVVYPCPIEGGESMECATGEAARKAAAVLLRRHAANAEGYLVALTAPVLVVVPRHMARARVEGVARLAFRPKTRATAAWLSETAETCARWQQVFETTANDGTTAAHVGVKVG